MRGKYSPTISERYIDQYWWVRNGGGYGLLADGTQMSETYADFDHEGYDPFGYGRNGRDRAGHSVRDYAGSEELFYQTVEEYQGTHNVGKPAHEYWTAVTEVAALMEDRFPGLPVVHPQDDRPGTPHIAIHVVKGGGYAVELRLEDADGAPRSLDIRFDDGAGGSSRADRTWTVNAVARSGGETRRAALCMMETSAPVLSFAADAVSAYDPDRLLHDVLVSEGGDGSVYLEARPRSERARGDVLGSVYASDAKSAIETLAARYEDGGTVQRMAARGIRRLGQARRELPSSLEGEAESMTSESLSETPRLSMSM